MFNLYDLAQANDYTMPLDVNGHTVEAFFTREAVEEVLDPLLRALDEMVEEKGSRLLVFLAAAPGTGKSTLASFLEARYEELDLGHMLQACGLDGFHHTNAWLDEHNLRSKKGAPETFDVDAFKEKLNQLGSQSELSWPVYDRKLHEPVEDGINIEGDIVLIEGNWLLLDEEPWSELIDYADFTIMVTATEAQLKERLISRKTRGGISREDAEAHYARTDGPNIERVHTSSQEADLVLVMNDDGDFSVSA